MRCIVSSRRRASCLRVPSSHSPKGRFLAQQRHWRAAARPSMRICWCALQHCAAGRLDRHSCGDLHVLLTSLRLAPSRTSTFSHTMLLVMLTLSPTTTWPIRMQLVSFTRADAAVRPDARLLDRRAPSHVNRSHVVVRRVCEVSWHRTRRACGRTRYVRVRGRVSRRRRRHGAVVVNLSGICGHGCHLS